MGNLSRDFFQRSRKSVDFLEELIDLMTDVVLLIKNILDLFRKK